MTNVKSHSSRSALKVCRNQANRQLSHRAWPLRSNPAVLLPFVLLLISTDAVAQPEKDIKQFLELHQHDRARAAFGGLIRELPQSELLEIGWKEPWYRHLYLAELCEQRNVEVTSGSVESQMRLALTKLGNGKVEAADLIATTLRNSPDQDVRDEFAVDLRKRIESVENRQWDPPVMKHWFRGNLELLSGDYSKALEDYETYVAAKDGHIGNTHFPAWITWCRAKMEPDAPPRRVDNNRTSHFAVATILSQQGKTEAAIAAILDGIRSPEGNTGRRPVPFFLEDFPACHRLLQQPTPAAMAARREYEILLKLHKVAAAVVAFQKQNGHFPRAELNGVSWRKQILPFFRLPEGADVVEEMYAIESGDSVTPFVVVTGTDTAFSPGEQTAPGRQIPDGTSNTLMICVPPQPVRWDSTEDMTAEKFLAWRKTATDGTFIAACDGQVDWYSADYSIHDWQRFVNRRDSEGKNNGR